VVGSLASPVNRMSDLVIFAPTGASGPLPSIVCLLAALAALVQLASQESPSAVETHLAAFNQAYQFLTQPETSGGDDETVGAAS
jgi:hypothetical protein